MGAWDPYAAADGQTRRWYQQTTPWTYFAPGSARAYGCEALKGELAARGFTRDGFGLLSPVIGSVAGQVIRDFQAAVSIAADGVAGPTTTEFLFAARLAAAEAAHGVPSRWAAKIVKLESAEDPGAVGWADVNDKGMAQINVLARKVSAAEAYDPAFAFPYLCADLASAHASLKDWEGAVASWNVGLTWATRWVAAGKPTSGALDPKNSVDWFTRASNYVGLVGGQNLVA